MANIFSGKKGDGVSYEQWWENYLANKPDEAAAKRKRSARGKIQYAKRLASADKDVEYKGRMYSPGSNRMRYLMEQLSEDDRKRLRKGIYDDSDTQAQIAEQMIENEDMSDDELARLKEENEDLWRRRNAETLRKRGGKLPPPKMPF